MGGRGSCVAVKMVLLIENPVWDGIFELPWAQGCNLGVDLEKLSALSI